MDNTVEVVKWERERENGIANAVSTAIGMGVGRHEWTDPTHAYTSLQGGGPM